MPKELELKYIVSEDFSIIRVLELLTKNGYWVMDYENQKMRITIMIAEQKNYLEIIVP